MAQPICVTGASGQAGRAVVTGLRAHGYDVTATDVAVTSRCRIWHVRRGPNPNHRASPPNGGKLSPGRHETQ